MKSEAKPRRPAAKAEGPLYLQIARILRADIVSGAYPLGSQMPTEEVLCARFEVSRFTVREALRKLREDNLISSRQGAGTIVAPQRRADAYAQDLMSINDLVSWSVGKRFAFDSMEMVAVDDKLATRTGLTRGEEWLAVCGYGFTGDDKAPECWAEYYINKDFAAVGRLLPRHTGPIFPLIEDLFGQKVVEVHQDIGAAVITPALAEGLKVKAGTAVLEVRRAFNLANGKTAQVTISTYPAQRFRHSMTMRRVKG